MAKHQLTAPVQFINTEAQLRIKTQHRHVVYCAHIFSTGNVGVCGDPPLSRKQTSH